MAEASDDAWLPAVEMGFPLDFQKYESKQHESLPFFGTEKYWVLRNADNEEPEDPPAFVCSWSISTSGLELKEKIIVLLKELLKCNALTAPSLLIQFWKPVLIEGRTLLTTRHQPFAINSIHEGLCRYRVISERYKFYVDEQQIKDELGLLGRVFVHKLPEYSPSIEYYTSKEYPQRQHALDCQITCVNAYPVLSPDPVLVGVLEIVVLTERETSGYKHPYDYLSFPEEGDLEIPDLEGHSYLENGNYYESFDADSEEIIEVLEKVFDAHDLHLAQTWAVCSLCKPNSSYTGQVMSCPYQLSSGSVGYETTRFREICDLLHLREGQGVVGQALSSHGMIFCPDITQFSIVEYPLAHFAKFYGIRSSFAICLQCSRTGSNVFVLEFFLPSSPIVNESVINLLRSILGTMKLHFQTFKLASGKDLGEKLRIQVVEYSDGVKYNCRTLEVESHITTSPQSPPGTLQDEGEIMQQDPSFQRSMDKVANAEQSNINCTLQDEGEIMQQDPSFQRTMDKVANAEQSNINCTLQDEGELMQQDPSSQQPVDKVANAEQSNINCTSSRGNGTSKKLGRPRSETAIQLGLRDILPHAKKNIADAAEALNVSRSTLKRICREHNINRWPPRNIQENCSQPQGGDDDGQQILNPNRGMPSTSNQLLPTIAPTNSHDTMMRHVNFVNVKAIHEDVMIKFELLLSSGLVELQHEITKRLDGTYNIKYKDEENDLISITCDEDVRYWIRTCGSQGSNSLKVYLSPK